MTDELGCTSYDRQEPVENITTWVYETDSFVPCAKLVNNERYSIISDYIGRPIQAYNDTGNLVWETDYDIYGNPENLKGDRYFISFRFQGQYYDVETDLCYSRFRYYSSESGTFISQDPIGLAGGNPTLYGYVFDSNTEIDPFGLDCKVKIKKGDGVTHDIVAEIKRSDFGEASKHLDDIANGQIHTINRTMAKSNRSTSLKGYPTKKGFDRDEVPMAMFSEGGKGASVRYINPSDNRAAGSAVAKALQDYPDKTRVLFKIID